MKVSCISSPGGFSCLTKTTFFVSSWIKLSLLDRIPNRKFVRLNFWSRNEEVWLTFWCDPLQVLCFLKTFHFNFVFGLTVTVHYIFLCFWIAAWWWWWWWRAKWWSLAKEFYGGSVTGQRLHLSLIHTTPPKIKIFNPWLALRRMGGVVGGPWMPKRSSVIDVVSHFDPVYLFLGSSRFL